MTDFRRAEERYGFDFSEKWDWKTLETGAAETEGVDDLARLKELVSIEDARFLFAQIARLEDPNEIVRRADYQRLQEEWGGSFHGMLPDPLGRELPVPSDLPSLIRAALLIAQAREENLEALKKAIPDYPLRFFRTSFPTAEEEAPPGWELKLDLSAIRGMLDLFRRERITREEAAAVAALPAFGEVLRHRRELGYIPEPLITADGLAAFILHAASREPLDMLWKWLTPHNFFDLADLFFHREEYTALIETIESHKGDLEAHILGAIGRYAPPGIVFQDRLAFTVGWGIAGWATNATGGVNIEHFKDDYERLLRTLTHETFHRFQLRVCPAAPDLEGPRRFEDLACFPFPDERDRKFYEIISYIFLEGTATFVAPSHPPVDREASVKRGAELLHECFEAVYYRRELERAEELLTEGMRSNGPFYWLGAHITEAIVTRGGERKLAAALTAGAPAFFDDAFSTGLSSQLHLPREIGDKVQELAAMIGKSGSL